MWSVEFKPFGFRPINLDGKYQLELYMSNKGLIDMFKMY